jgi:carboxyl-terminal processing protease
VKTSVGVVELPKPIFAFSVQLDDTAGGNGDGLAQRGEKVVVRVDVRNGGTGASGDKTWVSLKNLGDEKLFIEKGRDVIGALKPGEVKSAAMEVDLRRGSKTETLPIRVTIYDEKMDEYVTEKLDWPVATEAPPRTAAAGAVRVEAAEAQVRVGASGAAAPIALAKRGAVLPVQARYGDFYRVEWQKGRPGFVAAEDVKPAKGPRSGTVSLAWQREPPRIALSPDPAKGSPVVESDTWKLTGTASVPPNVDPEGRLRDVFVFVNDQKVFFKVVPEAANAQKVDFATDLPLQPGQNVVTVFAREDEEFQTRRSLVIFRRPPEAVAADAASGPPRRQAQ